MKIVQTLPPVYDLIIQAGMQPTKNTVYTYGDTIYVGDLDPNLDDHLIEHEHTHFIQQGNNPDAWWNRYLTDIYFRIDQEAEAYGHQYTFICKKVKDRNMRNKILIDLARFLSGLIYGNVITPSSAMRMIKNKSNIK